MDRVSGGEFIIRRIPPGLPDFDTTKESVNGKRATSATLGLRDSESGLSCSRINITKPLDLLEQAGKTVQDGWMVCIWKVSDIPDDLEVVVTPSEPPELDPGHCEIRAKPGKKYDQKAASKLSKKSRILTAAEIEDPELTGPSTDSDAS